METLLINSGLGNWKKKIHKIRTRRERFIFNLLHNLKRLEKSRAVCKKITRSKHPNPQLEI